MVQRRVALMVAVALGAFVAGYMLGHVPYGGYMSTSHVLLMTIFTGLGALLAGFGTGFLLSQYKAE